MPLRAIRHYEAGGNGSLSSGGTGLGAGTGASETETASTTPSGFFRSVTIPTTMGIAMKITLKHNDTTPIVVAAAGSLLPNTSIFAPGTRLASTEVLPKHKPNKPGQPHRRAVAMVAIRPVVLLSISDSPLRKKCDDMLSV